MVFRPEPNRTHAGSFLHPKDPTFVKGMAFENGGKVEEIDQLKGERVVAWFGGQNRGSVTQWLYPSGDEEARVRCG